MTQRRKRQSTPQQDFQPDPMLREGPRSRLWLWTVAAIVVVAIVGTFFAVNSHQNSAQNGPDHGPPITTGSGSTAPQPALPGGRNTSHAPLNGNSSTVR